METYQSKRLKDTLAHLTIDFSFNDWRKVRNKDYWRSDYMPLEQALAHKIERIEYYNRNGMVMPYSAFKVDEFVEAMNSRKNKSIL